MSYYNIHKALTQSVIDMSLGLPIAYENTDFNTETEGGEQYLTVNILFSEQNTVTKTNLDDVNGFLQISCYTKSGTSVGAMYTLVDTLNANYTHAKQFQANGQVINIQNISVNKRSNGDGWYITDFTINFWANMSRI